MQLTARRVGAMAPAALSRAKARSLVPAVKAFKEDVHSQAKQAPKDAAKPDEHHDQAAAPAPAPAPGAAVAPRGWGAASADLAAPLPRMASLFDEMDREFSALTRAFFGDDAFSFSPRAARRAAAAADPWAGLLAPALPRGGEVGAILKRLATDVSEDDKAYTIKADMPGIPKEDIKVTLHEGVLTISGERSHSEDKEEGGRVKWMERSHGRFVRSFALPENVDAEGIKAAVDNGVMTVTVPKVPEPEKPSPKDIPVEGA